jgi:hypothetical protein
MNDLEGGTLALALHFQKTDRLFLLSFLEFDKMRQLIKIYLCVRWKLKQFKSCFSKGCWSISL